MPRARNSPGSKAQQYLQGLLFLVIIPLALAAVVAVITPVTNNVIIDLTGSQPSNSGSDLVWVARFAVWGGYDPNAIRPNLTADVLFANGTRAVIPLETSAYSTQWPIFYGYWLMTTVSAYIPNAVAIYGIYGVFNSDNGDTSYWGAEVFAPDGSLVYCWYSDTGTHWRNLPLIFDVPLAFDPATLNPDLLPWEIEIVYAIDSKPDGVAFDGWINASLPSGYTTLVPSLDLVFDYTYNNTHVIYHILVPQTFTKINSVYISIRLIYSSSSVSPAYINALHIISPKNETVYSQEGLIDVTWPIIFDPPLTFNPAPTVKPGEAKVPASLFINVLALAAGVVSIIIGLRKLDVRL